MASTAAEVWELLGELVASQKETERRFQETERIIKEQSQESEKRSQETDPRFQEMEQFLKEQTEQTNKEITSLSQEVTKVSQEVNKVSQEVKRVTQQIGALGGKWGAFVENMVATACETLFLNRGIPVHQVGQRIKRHLGSDTLEIDILVTNQDHVLIVEVKSTLGVEDIKEFILDLGQFKQFFPEYKDKQLYGAVAGITIEDGADKYATRQGLFVLVQSGETMTILNGTKFEPKSW